MLHKTPELTTMGGVFRMKTDIKKELLTRVVEDTLIKIGSIANIKIFAITEREDDIELLPFPLYIERPREDTEYIFIDQRPFMTKTADGYKISNLREYNLNLIKGLLQAQWVVGQTTPLKSDGALSGKIYTSVLSSSISNHFGLDPKQKAIVSAVTAAFYGQQLSEMDNYSATVAMFDISKYSGLDQGVAKGIADKVLLMDDLGQYCTTIIEQVGSKKLRKFNPGMLLTILSRIFFGYNAKELIAIALEYPPYWAAMSYVALTDASYKHSYLARMAETNAKHSGESFIKMINNLEELVDR